ncbi:MAG: 4-(cytidine 5'-diphospho)-2-C-methyl-D-erythritol kinase [bacterium]
MNGLFVKAPAKINLVLNIGRKVGELHLLRSIVLKVDLYDELRFIVEGEDLEIISNIPLSENLISKSYNLLKEEDYEIGGVKVYLDKKIPIGGGLGGGSSDVACALTTMNHLFNLKIGKDKMIDYGFRIGSDVPFFIVGENAMMSHFGNFITPINVGLLPDIIIAWSDVKTDTKSVYEKFDKTGCKGSLPDGFTWGRFIKSVEEGDIDKIDLLIFNDLEICILKDRNDIIHIKEIMKEEGIKSVMMSGSGSGVFGFSDDRKRLKDTARVLEREGYSIHIGKIIR